jgi:hypothetical protein
MEPRNRFQGINTARLCSLAGRYDNPLPPRFLAPIASLKIPAQTLVVAGGRGVKTTENKVHWPHKVHIYLEYHNGCPLVQIGTPPPLPQASVIPPRTKGGVGTHSTVGEGGGVPIRTTGGKALLPNNHWEKLKNVTW